MPDHCVKLRFPFAGTNLGPIYDVEDALGDAISAAGVGEFDGNDVGEGECVLYMYRPDADALFKAIQPVITTHREILSGDHALLRNGPPENGIRELQVQIANA